ncbi:MAG: tetratricopeptide repeat protein [Bacteroidetes bacterium]|nr:tetratricopeptide repeat protein [Bacteroidota bacterium]
MNVLSKFPGWIFLFYVLFWSLQELNAQDTTDPYRKELGQTKNDKDRMGKLIALSFKLYTLNPQRGLAYGMEGLKLAEKLGDKTAIANAHSNIGLNYLSKADGVKGLEHSLKALDIFREANDIGGLIRINTNIGNAYLFLSNNEKAVTYYSQALQLTKKYKDIPAMAMILGNLGETYRRMQKYTLALNYYDSAIYMSGLVKDSSSVCRNLLNKGCVYSNLLEFKNAIRYFHLTAAQADKLHDLRISAASLYNIADAWRSIATENQHKNISSYSRELDTSVYYFLKAIPVCKKLDNIEYLSLIYNQLSEIEKSKGNYLQALKYSDSFYRFKDTLTLRNNAAALNKVETKRQLELKDKEIQFQKLQLIKKRNEKIWLISGISVLLLGSFFLFRERRKAVAARIKSDHLLLNILPLKIADELKSSGYSEARKHENVTVLFTDFVNFTGISENMDPAELVAEIHRLFTAFDNIATRNNLEKIKTIGDSYMAACGIPESRSDHAYLTVKSALEIRDWMKSNSPKFDIRIGVNSGPIVAGIVGVKKYAYDIWGDTVNTASRMESGSEPGQVNVSESTYKLVADQFDFIHRGLHVAKHKGEINMYFADWKEA